MTPELPIGALGAISKDALIVVPSVDTDTTVTAIPEPAWTVLFARVVLNPEPVITTVSVFPTVPVEGKRLEIVGVVLAGAPGAGEAVGQPLPPHIWPV